LEEKSKAKAQVLYRAPWEFGGEGQLEPFTPSNPEEKKVPASITLNKRSCPS